MFPGGAKIRAVFEFPKNVEPPKMLSFFEFFHGFGAAGRGLRKVGHVYITYIYWVINWVINRVINRVGSKLESR